MPKFFVKQDQIKEDIIEIKEEDIKHIKNVLRKEINDEIEICNQENGDNYKCKIEQINQENIKCRIIEKIENRKESQIYVDIYQGLPKVDKMELIIQKSVELGVYRIIPTNMKRCIVKIEAKEEHKKIERWQKISEVAAKQSGRNLIPKVENITNVKKISNELEQYDILLVAYEEEQENTLKQELVKIKQEKKEKLNIGIVIGPEGGIDKEEIEILKQSGAKIVTLGQRILRTETVALNILSIIMYELE
ncbi:MAG: 16S rRNA (uracil(1498)-N(3))-methyltransferase [Clostridia bacterium]|nr:16S rRNA (uracil(1498)-N(3))-methyltransferase [Clostridia bacterium]